jgi:hypothetical protein
MLKQNRSEIATSMVRSGDGSKRCRRHSQSCYRHHHGAIQQGQLLLALDFALSGVVDQTPHTMSVLHQKVGQIVLCAFLRCALDII